MMSDLIDRQEAIKALTMFGAEHNAIAVIRGCPSRGKASDGDDLIYRQAAIDALDRIGSLDTEADKKYARSVFEALPSAQPQYEELTPEEVASEIASGSTMTAWYWLDDMIRIKQMGYVICKKTM